MRLSDQHQYVQGNFYKLRKNDSRIGRAYGTETNDQKTWVVMECFWDYQEHNPHWQREPLVDWGHLWVPATAADVARARKANCV